MHFKFFKFFAYDLFCVKYKKNRSPGGKGGQILFWCELKPHAKLQNLGQSLLGEKHVTQKEK